jgi:hypothetical protein
MAKGPTPRRHPKPGRPKKEKPFDSLSMLFPKRHVTFTGDEQKTYTVVVTMPSFHEAPPILELIQKIGENIRGDKFIDIASTISAEIFEMINRCISIKELDVDVSLDQLPVNVSIDVIEAFIQMHDLKKWRARAEAIAATLGFQGQLQELLTRIKSGIPSAVSPRSS